MNSSPKNRRDWKTYLDILRNERPDLDPGDLIYHLSVCVAAVVVFALLGLT